MFIFFYFPQSLIDSYSLFLWSPKDELVRFYFQVPILLKGVGLKSAPEKCENTNVKFDCLYVPTVCTVLLFPYLMFHSFSSMDSNTAMLTNMFAEQKSGARILST